MESRLLFPGACTPDPVVSTEDMARRYPDKWLPVAKGNGSYEGCYRGARPRIPSAGIVCATFSERSTKRGVGVHKRSALVCGVRCRRLVRSEGGWWWFLTRRQWKVLMRTLRGNTADCEEEVWCWNARQLSAGLVDAGGSRLGIKWRWLGETLCEHTPDVVCF